MARKWLSGALAFAMIFGCSAPVALADETPVEVVEVEQNSLEEVEQYANYLPSLSATEIEIVPGETATVKVEGINEKLKVTVSETITGGTATYDAVTQTITVTTVADQFKAEGTVTVKIESEDKGDVVIGSPLTLTVKPAEKEAEASGTLDWSKDTGDVEITKGSTANIDIKAETVGGATTLEPKEVSYRITTGGSDYVTVEKSQLTNDEKEVIGTRLTLTGLKAIPSDTTVKVEVTARATADSLADTKTFTIKVTDPKEATKLDLTASKSEANVNVEVSLVAQAYGEDEYGDDVALDGDQGLQWAVNGTAMKFEKGVATIKDALTGVAIVTLTEGNNDGIMTFKAAEAGEYRITVSDESGNLSRSVTVTVKSAVSIHDTWSPRAYTKDINVKDENIVKTVQAGATVDMSDIKYSMFGTDEKLYPISTFNGVATMSVENVVVNGTTLDSAAAKGIVTFANGTATVAGADNATMAQIIEMAGDKDITINLKVGVKFSDTDTRYVHNNIDIVVTAATGEVETIEYYAGSDKIGTYTDADKDAVLNMPVLTAGTPVTVSVKAMDANKFTDGISQTAIYAITNINPNDTTVYATVDQTTGVVTPLVPCTGAAKLTIVPVANTAAAKTVNLYIVADPTATPEPSTTPEPSPTTEPSTTPEPSPTAAPVVRTGVVVNVSSNLNIRAAANTSSTVVTKVKNGTDLIILGEEGNFYKVQLADGKIGYASKDYVRETTDTPVQPTGDYAIVTTSGGRLNMRQTAGGAVITSIANGTRVDVISEGSEWTLIEYNGRQGYVSTAYLTIYHGAVG